LRSWAFPMRFMSRTACWKVLPALAALASASLIWSGLRSLRSVRISTTVLRRCSPLTGMVFSELLAQGVAYLAQGRARLDGGQDEGEEVFGGLGRGPEALQGARGRLLVPARLERLEPADLLRLELGGDPQDPFRLGGLRHLRLENVDPDDLAPA